MRKPSRHFSLTLLTPVLILMGLLCTATPDAAAAVTPSAADDDNRLHVGRHVGADDLATIEDIEREALDAFLNARTWPRRAIGALRLERYGCDESERLLRDLLEDPDWQVRCFAIHSLGRRHLPIDRAWLESQNNPRVIRTALRYRYTFDPERLRNGVRSLQRARTHVERLLAVEIAVSSGDERLHEDAVSTLRTIVLRMNRIEAGEMSARLGIVTGRRNLYRQQQWQSWQREHGSRLTIDPVHNVPERSDNGSFQPLELTVIGALDPEPFYAFEKYVAELSRKRIDLAVVMDATGSMGGVIGQAQAGVDNLMAFMGDFVQDLRVGVVGFRDIRDQWTTRHWDFTSNIGVAREGLWSLTASGGGDANEAVDRGLEVAFTQLSWNTRNTMVCILIGDAPPNVGYGHRCVQLTEWAADHGVTTHVIQTRGNNPVKWFPEIAEAGGGKHVWLQRSRSLVAEITALTIGGRFEQEFEEFFEAYLYLCG